MSESGPPYYSVVRAFPDWNLKRCFCVFPFHHIMRGITSMPVTTFRFKLDRAGRGEG